MSSALYWSASSFLTGENEMKSFRLKSSIFAVVDVSLRFSVPVFVIWTIVAVTNTVLSGHAGIKKKINPMSFSILSTYPNPFNPTTTIRFNIAVETFHRTSLLQIFDITGRVVETLVNENLVPGKHDVVWDANNQVSGIYFVDLVSGQNRSVQKLVLLK